MAVKLTPGTVIYQQILESADVTIDVAKREYFFEWTSQLKPDSEATPVIHAKAANYMVRFNMTYQVLVNGNEIVRNNDEINAGIIPQVQLITSDTSAASPVVTFAVFPTNDKQALNGGSAPEGEWTLTRTGSLSFSYNYETTSDAKWRIKFYNELFAKDGPLGRCRIQAKNIQLLIMDIA